MELSCVSSADPRYAGIGLVGCAGRCLPVSYVAIASRLQSHRLLQVFSLLDLYCADVQKAPSIKRDALFQNNDTASAGGADAFDCHC